MQLLQKVSEVTLRFSTNFLHSLNLSYHENNVNIMFKDTENISEMMIVYLVNNKSSFAFWFAQQLLISLQTKPFFPTVY